jgi:hypothetical protein
MEFSADTLRTQLQMMYDTFTGRNTRTTVRQIWHPQIVYLSITFSYNNYIIIIIITTTIICNTSAISKKKLWNMIRFYEHSLTSSALADNIGTCRHQHLRKSSALADIISRTAVCCLHVTLL